MTRLPHPRILVIQPLPGIGDTLWFLPPLKALVDHFSQSSFSLLTKKSSKAGEVLAGQVPLEQVLWLDRLHSHKGIGGSLRLISTLKRYAFHQAWIFHKSPRYALIAKMAGIPKVYGYGSSYGRFLVTPPVLSKHGNLLHPIQKAEALLHAHHIPFDPMTYAFQADPVVCHALQERYKIEKQTPLVILGIGGSEPYKKWPLSYFSALAFWLFQKGYRVFALGGMKEKEEALKIQENVQNEGGVLTPVFDLSLKESFALLSLANFFVGNDTSMLNASALLNRPTLGLFAKTPPLTYRPNLKALTAPSDKALDSITIEEVCQSLFP